MLTRSSLFTHCWFNTNCDHDVLERFFLADAGYKEFNLKISQ